MMGAVGWAAERARGDEPGELPGVRTRSSLRTVDARVVDEWRRPWLLAGAVLGAVVLALTWWWALADAVPDLEIDAFRWFNRSWPDGLEPVLWLPMQFGAIGAVAVATVALVVVTRQWLPAATTALVGIECWGLAKVVKPIVDRGRPGVEIDDVIHRGGSIGGGIDAGHGFVSGHSAIAAGLAIALTLLLPPRWRWVPWVLAAIVGAGRMYFGAHLPLDIVGGYGLGALCAGLTFALLARTLSRRSV